MKYRIISDTHFSHAMMHESNLRKVGFEQTIMNNLRRIPKEDTLIHLGDIGVTNDEYNHTEYIQKLECRKILVRGNHDSKSNQWYQERGWDFVMDSFILNRNGYEIMFIHIPTEETHEWVNKKENRLVIHGHYHNRANVHKLLEDRHVLYSCELDNNMPITLENMIGKYTKFQKSQK